MKCLFLGYNKKRTKLINFLKKKKIKVVNKNTALLKRDLKTFDIIISFGYRKIIPKNLIKECKRPIINLHMSYLPFNKGAHPNFWSFVNNTTKGVSIHEIDEGIDTGKIIYQKKIKFKKVKNLTFQKTYNTLFREIEKLFIKNFHLILKRKYQLKKNTNLKGQTHYINSLPKNLKSWKVNILKYLQDNINNKS